MPQVLPNPGFRPEVRFAAPDRRPEALHARLPGYQATPLRRLDPLARRLGVGSVHVKDESRRLGLPAYKVLGAAWAAHRILQGTIGEGAGPVDSLEQWRERLAAGPRLRLVTATDGNHGRGVARVARWLGVPATIYLPVGSAPSRLEGIRSEAAEVVEVAGTYDEAVARAAADQGPGVLLVQDHGWPGYEEIPGWIADGYETILAEVDRQLDDAPDVVLVQIGVGTLASAVVRHYYRAGAGNPPRLVGVEPTGAACALHSIESGVPVMLQAHAHSSIMAGLNCGTPSSAAWPFLRDGIAAYVAVEDELARAAMRELAAAGVEAGESGAAGLAGLLELLRPEQAEARALLGLGPSSRVLLLVTEGATDPVSYTEIVGAPPRRLDPAG